MFCAYLRSHGAEPGAREINPLPGADGRANFRPTS